MNLRGITELHRQSSHLLDRPLYLDAPLRTHTSWPGCSCLGCRPPDLDSSLGHIYLLACMLLSWMQTSWPGLFCLAYIPDGVDAPLSSQTSWPGCSSLRHIPPCLSSPLPQLHIPGLDAPQLDAHLLDTNLLTWTFLSWIQTYWHRRLMEVVSWTLVLLNGAMCGIAEESPS